MYNEYINYTKEIDDEDDSNMILIGFTLLFFSLYLPILWPLCSFICKNIHVCVHSEENSRSEHQNIPNTSVSIGPPSFSPPATSTPTSNNPHLIIQILKCH